MDSISSHLLIILRGSITSRFRITARILAHPLHKSHLTTSVPGGLATGSLLEITRLASHQLYIKHRTGAPTDIILSNFCIIVYYIYFEQEEREKGPLGIVELDTVEGIKDGELLFTIMFPYFSLMLAYKTKSKLQEEIKKILDFLEEKLDSYFYILFKKGIPDNGCEFLDFNGLEKSIHLDLKKRMKIHYTHAYAPYEKPHIENNHILLRWLIQKGYDITLLSSDDIIDIINRLNNYPRAKKEFKTPLQLLAEELRNDVLELLNLHHIPIEELNMKDMIIKNQERSETEFI